MTVESSPIPGVYRVLYWVDLRDGFSCDCKHGSYKDTPCAHVKAAQEFQQGLPVAFWREGR